ncbi:Uncharacterised protein [Vibrio cholerae]|nr:Uncharacterised protein [Vibrio cholerae]
MAFISPATISARGPRITCRLFSPSFTTPFAPSFFSTASSATERSFRVRRRRVMHASIDVRFS